MSEMCGQRTEMEIKLHFLSLAYSSVDILNLYVSKVNRFIQQVCTLQ